MWWVCPSGLWGAESCLRAALAAPAAAFAAGALCLSLARPHEAAHPAPRPACAGPASTPSCLAPRAIAGAASKRPPLLSLSLSFSACVRWRRRLGKSGAGGGRSARQRSRPPSLLGARIGPYARRRPVRPRQRLPPQGRGRASARGDNTRRQHPPFSLVKRTHTHQRRRPGSAHPTGEAAGRAGR